MLNMDSGWCDGGGVVVVGVVVEGCGDGDVRYIINTLQTKLSLFILLSLLLSPVLLSFEKQDRPVMMVLLQLPASA